MIAAAMLAAVLLDTAFGEPRRWHPLLGFGRCAAALERRCNGEAAVDGPGLRRRLRGGLALALVVLPWMLAVALLGALPHLGLVTATLTLYLCIGHRSLREHAQRVAGALRAGALPAARAEVASIVSRDTETLDARDVAAAGIESVLENGNDAVFGALFWFAVAGAPGVLGYRLVNTLDAMWGYRSPRYRDFGSAAARLDDLLNFVPARLTALSYALLGRSSAALRCWRRQAPACDSPNAGPVMAAGAGSLGLLLGGGARYQGVWKPRPPLGEGAAPDAAGIARALRLVARTLALWLLLAASIEALCHAGA